VQRAANDLNRFDQKTQQLTFFPRMHFVKWFGEFDTSRYQIVKGNYSSLLSLYNGTIKFDLCPAEKVGTDTAAWVYPDGEIKIYIAPKFWKIDARAQARVIVHESTHEAFRSKDFGVYGSIPSQNMAKSNPGMAIWHADSYAFHAIE
jgi:hypothetical protein